MSTLATYSFLPWLRQGLAGQITAADGDTSVVGRASVGVDLEVTGEAADGTPLAAVPLHRDVQIYGPGDVVGLDPRAIVRTDPRDWITNAEPNYLAHVELYDEDLPWRYTPAAPDGSGLRLRPWIALVVLKEGEGGEAGEFAEVRTHGERPCGSIEVTEPAALPAADDLWAWAHVHVNASLAAGTELVQPDAAGVASRLAAAVGHNRDVAYSRLVCPRRLVPNTRYHAFVVPTFETGRLAGLGLDPAGAPHATFSAWGDYAGKPAGATLPFYYRWYFRTGDQGDFEYLVRLLQPRTMPATVGVKDVDLRHPGSGIRGVVDPTFGGRLKLGGALRVPDAALTTDQQDERERFENWDQAPPAAAPYPQPFQADLAAFVNLADDYATQPAEDANAASGLPALDGGVVPDPDPLITSPLYGRWHALTRRLLVDRDGTPLHPDDTWVHELNLDPRHRLAAGFGTRVIQQNQEAYMDAAWGQVGDVLEANRRLRLAQLARLVGRGMWARSLDAQRTAPERVLTLTAPAHRHVLLAEEAVRTVQGAPAGTLGAGVVGSTPGTVVAAAGSGAAAGPAPAATLRHRTAVSVAGPTLLSAPMRRLTRPGARLARRLPWTAEVNPATLLTRADAGVVAAAPPVVTPPGAVTTDDLADTVDVAPLPGWVPSGLAAWLLGLLRRWRWLPRALLVTALVLAVVGLVLLAAGGGLAVLGVALVLVALVVAAVGWALGRSEAQLDHADALRPGGLSVAWVDRLPAAPGFVLTRPGDPAPSGGSGGDSPTAVRFKAALRDWATLRAAGVAVDRRPTLVSYGAAGLASLATGALAALDPVVTVPRRTLAGITVPGHLLADLVAGLTEDFGEVMAYPHLDLPMYAPLRDLSEEYLLPNLNLIPPNTISLLETNQAFIEAYMVGVNHEMARELLWREYPTDQRGTPFRQFWDVSGARPPAGLTGDAAKEALLDIPELHRWSTASHLGDHDHREKPGDNEQEAVLVIRGELLKKYPTAIIYAHRARWDTEDGHADPTKERVLAPLTPAQELDPPDGLVKTPLYEARVHPDLTFFGFDLTVTDAKGESGDDPGDDPGWFFCIKERPGEPRFGFDIDGEAEAETVNDLTWTQVGTAEGGLVPAGALGTVTLGALEPDDTEKVEQRADDVQAVAAPVSAARWAYLLYQAPVLVAVHAAEMLRPEGS